MALNNSQKQQIASKLAVGVGVLRSAYVELQEVSNDSNDVTKKTWLSTEIKGALLLTKNSQNCYHFRIYDLDDYSLTFLEEIYRDMEYASQGTHFHAFGVGSFGHGFKFTNTASADNFLESVLNTIPRTVPKPEDRDTGSKNESIDKLLERCVNFLETQPFDKGHGYRFATLLKIIQELNVEEEAARKALMKGYEDKVFLVNRENVDDIKRAPSIDIEIYLAKIRHLPFDMGI